MSQPSQGYTVIIRKIDNLTGTQETFPTPAEFRNLVIGNEHNRIWSCNIQTYYRERACGKTESQAMISSLGYGILDCLIKRWKSHPQWWKLTS